LRSRGEPCGICGIEHGSWSRDPALSTRYCHDGAIVPHGFGGATIGTVHVPWTHRT
jgi:hypothetical protein